MAISWTLVGVSTAAVTAKDRGTGDDVVVQDVVRRVDFLVTATNDAGTTGTRRDAIVLGLPYYSDEAILANAPEADIIAAAKFALGGAAEACEADAQARIGMAEEEEPQNGE